MQLRNVLLCLPFIGYSRDLYAQQDKDIVFGGKDFHNYLAVQTLTINFDHKPLKHLFAKLTRFLSVKDNCPQNYCS